MAMVESQIYYPRHAFTHKNVANVTAFKELIIVYIIIHHHSKIFLQLVRPGLILSTMYGRPLTIELLLWLFDSCCVLFLVYQTYKSLKHSV